MRVVTHAGQAHADDILALGLIFLKEDMKNIVIKDAECCSLNENKDLQGGLPVNKEKTMEITRVNNCVARDMTEVDWKDGWKKDNGLTATAMYPYDFVIDIGGACDPRKGWFDHHQMERDAKACCAFTLLASKYYKIELCKFTWTDKLSTIDSKGPMAWYSKTHENCKNCGSIQLPQSGRDMSKANGASDSIFTYISELANEDYCSGIFFAANWLKHQFDRHKKFEIHTAEAQKVAQVVDLGDCGAGNVKMIFFNTKNSMGTMVVSSSYQEEDPSIIISAMLDDRGDGYSAFRMDDGRIDFYLRNEDEGCVFAHKNGFILKWKKDWKSFVKAVKLSIDEQARFEKELEAFTDEDNSGINEDIDW